MNPLFERKILASFLLSLVVLLVIGVIAGRSTVRMMDDAAYTRQAEEVLTRLAALLSATTDVETGERGFVITGDGQFLDSYHAGVVGVGRNLGKLRSLLIDPAQRRRLEAVELLLAERLAFSSATIELRRAAGFAAAQRQVATGAGKEIHDRIRLGLAEMERAERGLLERQKQGARDRASFAQTAIVGGSVFSSLLICAAMVFVRFGFGAIRRTEAALREAHGLLEARVRERTAELTTTNKDLRTEVARRELLEATLRNKEQLLSGSQRIAHVGSWVYDLTGQITWSDEAYRIYRVSPDKFAPSPDLFFNLIHPEDRLLMQGWIDACISGERPGDLEFRTMLFDGAVRHLNGRVELVRNAEGHAIQMIGTVQDITERKRAEVALRENEALLSESQRIAKVGGWSWDFKGPIHWTEETYRIYGTSPETFTPTVEGLVALLHPEDRPAMQNWITACAAGQKPGDLECRCVWADGTVRSLNGRGELTSDAEHRPVRISGTVQDVTERKLAEQKLLESREQLRALLARLQRTREEERTRVAREIHDELGQLLTGLKMDVRWLERKLSEPGLSPTLNPLLDRVVAASELADTTIAAVQKIAAELRPGPLDQLGLAAALAHELRRFEERSGIKGTLTGAPPGAALRPEIASELFYIGREALTNVGRHASATKVEFRLRSEGGEAVLEVCDDGVGMDVDAPGDAHSLGLLGMRERALECGGSIAFQRNEPRGTKVVVRVPLAVAT